MSVRSLLNVGRHRAAVVLLSLVALLAGCSPFRPFYYPDRRLYIDPAHLGLSYEMVWFPSLNGRKLFGLLFRTAQDPKGLVVHFHGNFGNVSNHFVGSSFLVNHGFDVLIFDYQGFGGSEGRPTPARTVQDGVAALRMGAVLNRNPNGGVVVLAQSVGGAVALPAMAIEPLAKAAVVQASFPTYRGIARDVLGRSPILWILWPFYPNLLWTRYDPVKFLDRLPEIPLLFIHGDKDEVVPLRMTQTLFEKAREPKDLWVVPGAGHNNLRQTAGDAYDQRVAEFFSRALSTNTN